MGRGKKNSTNKIELKDRNLRAERVSNILIELTSDNNMRTLARQSGITAAYISMICKKGGNKERPLPSAEVLRKIADTELAKKKGVTLDDLMIAAGYQSVGFADVAREYVKSGSEDPAGLSTMVEKAHRFERAVKGIIFSAISEEEIQFKELPTSVYDGEFCPDIVLECKNAVVREWCFQLICSYGDDRLDPIYIENRFRDVICRMIFAEPREGRKVSIVISDKEVFELLKPFKGKLSYRGDLSLMWLNTAEYVVGEEVYLSYFDENEPHEVLIG